MRYIISICIACLVAFSTLAAKGPVAPKVAGTTEDILKAIEGFKGFGCIQTAQFNHWGRQVFAAWYCPFSGRGACYLHAYYYDYDKAQWIRFVDQLIEGSPDLSAEMPLGEDAVIFRGVGGKIAVEESVAKFPYKKWYEDKK